MSEIIYGARVAWDKANISSASVVKRTDKQVVILPVGDTSGFGYKTRVPINEVFVTEEDACIYALGELAKARALLKERIHKIDSQVGQIEARLASVRSGARIGGAGK